MIEGYGRLSLQALNGACYGMVRRAGSLTYTYAFDFC